MNQRNDAPVTILIPDTQVRPDAPDDHCAWAGAYIRDEFAGRPNVTIVHLGDHATMDSLSSYEKPGSKATEGKRYRLDIDAANRAFDKLNAPTENYNARRRKLGKPEWEVEKHFLLGNHEDRITRAINDNPKLEGALSLDDLNYSAHGWIVHPFLEVIDVHGIAMSHYFQNPGNGRPISGMIESRIKSVGQSFAQGHQQGLRAGILETPTGRKRGIVAGSFYIAPEPYRGPQGADEWKGILVLFECREGDYCLMEVSIDYLARRYVGMGIAEVVASRCPGGMEKIAS